VKFTLLRGGFAAALAAVLTMAGCASQQRVRQAVETRQGAVGMQVDAPGDEGAHRLNAGESARPPAFFERDQPLPVYPADQLARSLGPVTVPVLLSIDEQGHLSDVSFAGDTAPTQDCAASCIERFRAAVRGALAEWSFGPLEVLGFVDGPDEDGDGEADSVRRAVVATRAYSLRLRFTFELKEGRGIVRRDAED